VATLGELLPHLHAHALDIVQLRIGAAGITPALQRADAAFGLELPVVLCAAPGNVHAQLASVLPYCASVEVVEPLVAHGVYDTDVRIAGGEAIAGERAGHGLVLDPAALARASVAALPACGERA
jgi:Enolase C-terminal domain-like